MKAASQAKPINQFDPIDSLGLFNPKNTSSPQVFKDPANHITAKDYLLEQVYPVLEQALNNLISTIESNGEFERYVDMLAERQDRAQRDLRRRERERRRLELGDDYVSCDEDHSDGSGRSDKSSDDEDFDDDSYDEEEEDVLSQDAIRTPASFLESDSLNSSSSPSGNKPGYTKAGAGRAANTMPPIAEEIVDEFNAVRFLGQNLKELMAEIKKAKA